MQPKKVKIGVVGCGYIAQVDYFPVMAREINKEFIEVVALCDNVPGRAEEMCRQYGFGRAYTNYDEMLAAEPEMDLVAILTPIPVHFNQSVKALNAGKHIYIQKTMTVTHKEAVELNTLAKEKSLLVCPAPGQMVDTYHQQAKKIIDSGVVGKVCFAIGYGGHMGHENLELFGIDPSWYYKPGGGPMMDVAVYPITTLTALIGPAKRVVALSGIAIKDRYWKGRKLDVEMDDNTVINLDFGDGVFATIYGNFVSRRPTCAPQFQLYCSKGVIEIGGWTRRDKPLEVYTEKPMLGFESGWYRPTPPLNAKPGQIIKHTAADLLHIVKSILENRKPLLSGEHAAHVIEIIEKGYDSARTGKAIKINSTFTSFEL